jgi:hypothetical protein
MIRNSRHAVTPSGLHRALAAAHDPSKPTGIRRTAANPPSCRHTVPLPAAVSGQTRARQVDALCVGARRTQAADWVDAQALDAGETGAGHRRVAELILDNGERLAVQPDAFAYRADAERLRRKRVAFHTRATWRVSAPAPAPRRDPPGSARRLRRKWALPRGSYSPQGAARLPELVRCGSAGRLLQRGLQRRMRLRPPDAESLAVVVQRPRARGHRGMTHPRADLPAARDWLVADRCTDRRLGFRSAYPATKP